MDKLDRGVHINGVFLTLKGHLAKYPIKVIELMVDESVKQQRGLGRSIGLITVKALKALDDDATSGKTNGAFDWVHSRQGGGFWIQLINRNTPGKNNFNVIFDKSFKGSQ